MAPGAPRDAFTQAEGYYNTHTYTHKLRQQQCRKPHSGCPCASYRYLSRLARAGLENFMECRDVRCPRLVALVDGSRVAPVKLGSDNPDNLYMNATLHGGSSYRVWGSRGS